MHMDILLGIIIGMPIGVLIWWIKEHKSSISYDIANIKADMVSIHMKLDNILSNKTP